MRRTLGSVMAAAASLICIRLAVSALSSGSATDLGRASAIAGARYSATAEPSQFWFMVTLYVAGAVGFAWLAWRGYHR
ncbi:MAG TPA: hypothetical protein VIG54_08700 [Lysobacter sp.]